MLRTALLALSLSLPLALLACDGKGGGGGDSADDTGPGAGVDSDSGDADGDGYADVALGGDDCDDGDPAVNPGAEELCDGADNDCNGAVDDGAIDAPSWYVDSDGDGYGDAESQSFTSCEETPGLVSQGGDCDDGDPAVNPGAEELCDGGVDNDCDGAIDDVDPGVVLGTWFRDLDGDGYGDPADSTEACEAPEGFVGEAGDCDDGDGAVRPGAEEVCDGLDNDCDPATSEEGLIVLDALEGYTSIQEALDAAREGSEILVCEGSYSEALTVRTSVTLRSASGPERTTIDAGGAGAVIDVDSATAGGVELTVVGFTLTGGVGVLYTGGDLNGDGLVNDTIGGGISALYAADLSVEDCIIDGNTATLAGGVLGSGYLGGDSFTDTVFQNNIATESVGGGLYSFDAALIGTEFIGNEGVNGGAVFLDGSAGGGLSADADTRFVDNSALYGGALLLSTADLSAEGDTAFTDNRATYDKAGELGGFGGAVYALGLDTNDQRVTVAITGGSFSGNTADWGGGVLIGYADMVMSGGEMTSNSAPDGGGVALYGGTLEVEASDWGEGKTDNSLDDVALANDEAGDTGDTGIDWTPFDDFGASASFQCEADTLSCE